MSGRFLEQSIISSLYVLSRLHCTLNVRHQQVGRAHAVGRHSSEVIPLVPRRIREKAKPTLAAMSAFVTQAVLAQDIAYRLFIHAERKKLSAETGVSNAVAVTWHGLFDRTRMATDFGAPAQFRLAL